MAQEVYARLGLDRVWFVPTGAPPHKLNQEVSPAAGRLAMVERAIAPDERFAISTVELERPGPSYTANTVRELRASWGPAVELFFVLGWDMLLSLPQWHDPAGMLAALDGLVAVHRPGFDADPRVIAQLDEQIPTLQERLILIPMPQVEFSSSDIRQRVACGLPIRYLAPDTVCQYIAEHDLYQTRDRARAEPPAPERETASRRGEETT